METQVIDKLFLELSQVTKAKTSKELILLDAIQKVYRKHCMGDDSIGWKELDDVILTALSEAMGDKGFQQWLGLNRR